MLSSRCLHPIRMIALIALLPLGVACRGEIEVLESRAADPLMAGCIPGEIKCSHDIEGIWTCGCGDLWECNGNRTKCERPRFTPDGQGDWDCTWSREQYLCRKIDEDFNGSGGWTCSQGAEFSWECVRPAPTPNRKTGDVSWDCQVFNDQALLLCLRSTELHMTPELCDNLIDDDGDGLIDYEDPDCQVANQPRCITEICNNGLDDDCDGLIDGSDPQCYEVPLTCIPKKEACSNKLDDDCDGYADCDDPDCGEQCEFVNRCTWQTQQCDGAVDHCAGNEKCYRAWVDQRCNGVVMMNTSGDTKTFTCLDQEACIDFRCTTAPTECVWTDKDCGEYSDCAQGDEQCARLWVEERCSGEVISTMEEGNIVFKCTDELECTNVRCQVVPNECVWTSDDCAGQNTCTPGDEACHRDWVASRCDGVVNSSQPGDNKVFDCVDEEDCKTFRCEVQPPPVCTWSNVDCVGKHGCDAGDEACFRGWVDTRCKSKISVTTSGVNKVFKCTDGEPDCKNYRCKVVPRPVCVWSHQSCGKSSGCAAGNEACHRTWVDTRCKGNITVTTNGAGNKVYKCTDDDPICKTYSCEVQPKQCIWNHLDCGNNSGCNPGDEACYRAWVDTRCKGPITVDTNKAGNKVYNCTDGEPICKTYKCESKPQPPCVWKTTDCKVVDRIGHCNTHSGNNEQACRSAGRGDCGEEELKAWCTRRVSGLNGPGGLWDNYIKKWVEQRCGGVAELVDDGTGEMDLFKCTNYEKCEVFKCETPLVLVFDEESEVAYHEDDGETAFDLSVAQDGGGTRTDWPTAATPWLAMDLDGDGRISSGRELFGSATMIDGGGTARNGFEALAALDDNGDGKVDSRDPDFERLRIWTDHDGDRVTGAGELQELKTRGLVSLSLNYKVKPRCDPRGNCERERASFLWRDERGRLRRGAIVDVYLRSRRGAGAAGPRRTVIVGANKTSRRVRLIR